MAISLKCPGCGEPVVAQDSERGQTVKCGTCWASVPVPAGTAPSAALAKPATRTLTAVPAVAKPATASAKPLAAAVAKAVPVIAVPVVAMPVTAKPALKATPKKTKEKPRFQDREDDDEEDDGDETPNKKKGMGLLIGLGAAAVILVAGCGGLGWYFFGHSTTVASSNSTDGGGGKANGWKQFASGDGFAMDTPNGDAGPMDTKVNFGSESLDGRKYTQRDNGSTIQVAAIHCDLKGKALGRYTAGGMMLEMFAMPNLVGSDRGKRFIGDREAAEFVVDRGSAHDHIWISKVGDRVYGFQFHWESPEPSGVLDIKEAYFRSLAITHIGAETVDPNAPWNSGGTEPKGPLPIDSPWVAFPNNAGFTAEAPKGVKSEKIYYDRSQKKYHGRFYTTEDSQCFYHVLYHDVPVGDDADYTTILKAQHQFSFAEKSTETGKIDGKAATKWIFKAGYSGHGYSVTVGFRVFTFIALSKTGFGNKTDPTLEDRADKFYKSIKIAFDPKKYDPFADEPAWGPMAKAIGFTALAPKGTTVADHRVGFGKDEIKGTEYKSEQDALTFQVFAYDLPAGKTIDKIVSEQIRSHPIIDGPTAITLDGFAGEEVTVKDFSKFPIVLRSFKAGNRVFLAKLTRRYGNVSDMEYDSAKARFFANFHIGAGSGGVEPGDPAPKPGVTGELVKAGKVLPFWAAAVLPEKKELITVSIRDGNGVKPAGILRRYGYPDFKLKASYQLAVPMNRIAVDEKAGRLYLASVNVYDKTFVERELSFAQGDVQIFDLNKITDGALADLADLKPLNTIPLGSRISAFEFSPKDKQLYVSAITQTKVGTKQVFRGRLYKLDTEKQKLGDPIELPEAAWSMRLAADGGKLYVCGMPIAPGPVPTYAIEVIDTATWKRSKTLTVPAAPVDVALARDRILTIATGKAEPELLGVNEVGDIAELTPRGEAMTGARYLRTTSDGKRVLISGGGVGNNTATYLDVVLDAPPRLTRIAGGNVIDSINLGGHFLISPDDKFAIFNSGIVIDLDKTAGK